MSGFIMATMRSLISVSWLAPRARNVRSWLPKAFIKRGDGRNGTVGKAWLFKKHGRTVVFDQQISDGPCFVDHVHRAVDAEKFAPLFEVVHPPQRLPCHGWPWGFLV